MISAFVAKVRKNVPCGFGLSIGFLMGQRLIIDFWNPYKISNYDDYLFCHLCNNFIFIYSLSFIFIASLFSFSFSTALTDFTARVIEGTRQAIRIVSYFANIPPLHRQAICSICSPCAIARPTCVRVQALKDGANLRFPSEENNQKVFSKNLLLNETELSFC